jgi:hypothetical protein
MVGGRCLNPSTAWTGVSLSTTNPLSFDIDGLAARFLDFQTFTPASSGWNDDQGLYFVAAGSEYLLQRPTSTTGNLALSDAAKSYYRSTIATLQSEVDASATLTSAQKAAYTSQLGQALNELNTQPTFPGMTVNLNVEHIRNNQQDDHSAIEIQVIWCAALDSWLPSEVKIGFTWGTSALPVPNIVLALLGAPGSVPVLFYAGRMIPVLGQVLQCIALTYYSCEAWNILVAAITDIADDGGRLYFSMATVQTLIRVVSCIQPTATPGATMPAPDIVREGSRWVASYQNSTLDATVQYCSLSSVVTRAEGDGHSGTTTGTYDVSLPDLAWLPGGAGTLLTTKIAVEGTNSYAAVMLLFNGFGQVVMCGAVAQVGDDNALCTGPPATGDGTYVSGLINGYLETYFSQDAMFELVPKYGSDNDATHEANLPHVMDTVMQSFAANVRQISTELMNTGLPQLPTLQSSDSYAYATGGVAPTVACASNTAAVTVAVSPFGSDEMFAQVLTTGTSVTAATSADDYQDGQDPCVMVLPGGTHVLEVHGGNANNKLYYNVFSLSGTTLGTPSDGSNYDKGESPALAISGDTIFELHRDATSGSKKLFYRRATWNGSAVQWGSADAVHYEDAYNPCGCFAADGSTLVLGQDSGTTGSVQVTVATTTATTLQAPPTSTLCNGTDPSIVLLSGDIVVLMCGEIVDYRDSLKYSVGILRSGAIQWVVVGVRQSLGMTPCLSRRPDGRMVLVSQGTDGNLWASVQTLVAADGFWGPG